MMSAFDEYCENGNIGRVDAWHARGGRERFGLVAFQLFTALKTHGRALVVVQPFWNSNCLVNFCPFCGFTFLFNVRRVMTHNIYFLDESPK